MDKLIALIDTLTKWLQGAKPMVEKAGRLTALFDKSAWLMMAPALAVLYQTDPELAATMVQWTSLALAIAGAAIIVSRIVFPQISIGDLLEQVKSGNTGAGLVVSSVVVFVGLLFLGIVFWAKT